MVRSLQLVEVRPYAEEEEEELIGYNREYGYSLSVTETSLTLYR